MEFLVGANGKPRFGTQYQCSECGAWVHQDSFTYHVDRHMFGVEYQKIELERAIRNARKCNNLAKRYGLMGEDGLSTLFNRMRGQWVEIRDYLARRLNVTIA